jgi:hypothetical protein
LEIVLAALCRVWMRHLLKLAIAGVAATSERDFRIVGLDRAKILAALTALRSAAYSTACQDHRTVIGIAWACGRLGRSRPSSTGHGGRTR